MIYEADKRESELRAEVSELKKKDINTSTLISTHHIVWDNIQRVIVQEWPHLVVGNEEAKLVIMVNREVERITCEIDDKPFKFQLLIRWPKTRSAQESLQQGVRDRTTMIIVVENIPADSSILS